MCFELKIGLDRIGRSLNITLDHKNFVNDLYNLVGNDFILLKEYKEKLWQVGEIDLNEQFAAKTVAVNKFFNKLVVYLSKIKWSTK